MQSRFDDLKQKYFYMNSNIYVPQYRSEIVLNFKIHMQSNKKHRISNTT